MIMEKVKVAVVQMDPKLSEIRANMAKTVGYIEEAALSGAMLIAFPECSLTGYCFSSRELAEKSALTLNETWNQELIETVKETGTTIIVGFAEKYQDKLFNSALVIGSDGNKGVYRKTHLPELGVDNFVSAGNEPYALIETEVGKLGILICYDVRFPEQARILSLQGADLLVHITNLPLSASTQVDFLLPARANENRVHVVSSDRVGEENGFKFLGRSTIYDVNGNVVSEANKTDETIIYSELDFNQSREKNVFFPSIEGKPVGHTNYLFKSRRPELYTQISKREFN